MTETSRKKTKDTNANAKEGTTHSHKSDNVKYQYSVKLSSADTEKKDNTTPNKQHIDTTKDHHPQSKETIGKVATAQIPLDKRRQDNINLSQPQKNTLPTKFRDKAKTVLLHLSKHGSNSVAKKLLNSGDQLISFITAKHPKSSAEDVISKARSPIMFGIWIMIITFVLGGLWSGLAPLDSSAGAHGFVVVASKKQIIQHREGGIIDEIYVKEGEHVNANQPLIKLSDKTAKAQLNALTSQKESFSKQLLLIQSQLESMNALYEKGFVQKQKLIDLQAQEAQALGHLSDIEAKLLMTEESIERITIRSPVSGTVNQLQVHTIGGTVGSGMILMTIVPKEDDLIIEAYLQPHDIDSVHVGLHAKVRIAAFKSRTTAPLDGIVTFISSDVVEPPQQHTQESLLFQRGLYYKVKISIDKTQLRNISKYKDLELYPGMGADVMIVTGERTLLQYLLDPVTNTFWHAFIEK